jgi:hypothetical protein
MTQQQAIRVCNQILSPLFGREGFTGTFPNFHRLGTQCIECFTVSVYVRGGVQIFLGSMPLRAKLETRTAAQDVKRCLASNSKTTRYETIPGPRIGTASELRVLTTQLPKLARTVRAEGKVFWSRHDHDLVFRARFRSLEAAIVAGSASRLTSVLAPLAREDAQELLDVVRVKKWSERPTIVRTYALAPALLAWRPPWMLGGTLAAGAALALQTAKGPRARAATKVLAWFVRTSARSSTSPARSRSSRISSSRATMSSLRPRSTTSSSNRSDCPCRSSATRCTS